MGELCANAMVYRQLCQHTRISSTHNQGVNIAAGAGRQHDRIERNDVMLR